MSTIFNPKRSLAECTAMMTAPGAPLEMETTVVRGLVQRVYKNAPGNMRIFWLNCVKNFPERDYIVFEKERYTYAEAHAKVSRAASIFRQIYGVRKGDRVGIVMRNFPEWIIAFWATHLLGAVPVLVNAWIPGKVIAHCLIHTNCKLIIIDAERADKLDTFLAAIQTDAGSTGTLITRAHEGHGKWKNGRSWDSVLEKYSNVNPNSWEREPDCHPDDNGSIFFTSGTTGLPKGVLGTQRAAVSASFATLSAQFRAHLRRGDGFPQSSTQRVALLSVPLFHVTGCLSTLLTNTLVGGKMVLMRKWDVQKAVDLIITEKVTSAGGVPSIAMDLLESEKFQQQKSTLEQLGYGGAPAPPQIAAKVSKLATAVHNGQGYGLTETSAGVTSVLGEDSSARPLSAGLPCVVNDFLIVDPKTNKALPPGQIGEVWVRGVTVMVGYWQNPEATKKVLTRDGWFNSQDLGSLDAEGFLYINGRVKDIIIRGGENIDAVSVENALYEDERVLSCAVVGVPDARLGELPAAIVHLRPGAEATEEELIAHAGSRLPAFAVPIIIIFSTEPFEMNAAGKVPKDGLRVRVGREWEKRRVEGAKKTNKSKL